MLADPLGEPLLVAGFMLGSSHVYDCKRFLGGVIAEKGNFQDQYVV